MSPCQADWERRGYRRCEKEKREVGREGVGVGRARRKGEGRQEKERVRRRTMRRDERE